MFSYKVFNSLNRLGAQWEKINTPKDFHLSTRASSWVREQCPPLCSGGLACGGLGAGVLHGHQAGRGSHTAEGAPQGDHEVPAADGGAASHAGEHS